MSRRAEKAGQRTALGTTISYTYSRDSAQQAGQCTNGSGETRNAAVREQRPAAIGRGIKDSDLMKPEQEMNLEKEIRENVTRALGEDIGANDLAAGLVPVEKIVAASVISRESAFLCGTQWFDNCFQQLSPQVKIHWLAKDGDPINAGQVVCKVDGYARPILTAERTALNFLQLLSGVASQTRRYVEAVAGTGALIVDTRKTLPGLRLAQKFAVRCGGGTNHRLGLYDGMLIKENHVHAAGGFPQALRAAETVSTAGAFTQIEVETLRDLRLALNAGAKLILLDNFDLDGLREAVALNARLAEKKAILEASGGVTLRTVRAVAQTGVDRISVGSITKDITAVDLSMRFSSEGT
jgi:nicotinate-nucleotide pyrophosphorylase (carboxylating)